MQKVTFYKANDNESCRFPIILRFSIENLDSSVGYLRIVFVVGNHYDGGAVLKNATEAINEGGKNILFYNNALGQIRK